tara:strand:- start:149 stop:373 length:225 start_codon:yes stop_codon:yes gene_type:complete
MNKDQKKEMKSKLKSVEETLKVLYLQESNLLEVIGKHAYDHEAQHQWVHEVFITADYICRLDNACKVMRELLKK